MNHTSLKKEYDILGKFKDFTDGVRVLFLIQRNKEGGETNNTKLRKIVTTNPKEYGEALTDLLAQKYDGAIGGKKLRVYASVNPRNIEKAIREFKQQQLDADYLDDHSRHRFYYDVKNRFISALMKPSSKADSLFILDVDREDIQEVVEQLYQNAKADPHTKMITIVKKYKTKNGWHIVTTPFNPALVADIKDVDVIKDGLLLLSY
jgi:hypothetical protein